MNHLKINSIFRSRIVFSVKTYFFLVKTLIFPAHFRRSRFVSHFRQPLFYFLSRCKTFDRFSMCETFDQFSNTVCRVQLLLANISVLLALNFCIVFPYWTFSFRSATVCLEINNNETPVRWILYARIYVECSE